MAEILILTGPHGVGKTSVAGALADRYDRVAHIQVDVLRHFVTPTGYVAPGKPGFERQHQLAVRNACDLARNFLDERFAVIIDDTVPDEASLQAYLTGLLPVPSPVHFVRLAASLEVCQARNSRNKTDRQPPDRVERIWHQFEDCRLPGLVIDCTELTPDLVADRVQALTTSGESILHHPARFA